MTRARRHLAALAVAGALGHLAACAGDEARGLCETLADPPEAVGAPVEIRVVNEGTETVFIREVYGCTHKWFELKAGEDLVDAEPDGCDTCKEVLEESHCGRCSVVACLGLNFVGIAPGATFTVAWPGVTYESVEWPAECNYDADACAAHPPTSCVTPRAAAGAYTVRIVQAFAPTGCPEGACTCPPGQDTCTFATDTYDTFTDLSAPLELPGDTVLEFRLH